MGCGVVWCGVGVGGGTGHSNPLNSHDLSACPGLHSSFPELHSFFFLLINFTVATE